MLAGSQHYEAAYPSALVQGITSTATQALEPLSSSVSQLPYM